LPPFLWFFIKAFAVFALIIWIRSTWPRVRIDQLMAFAWKFMLPLSLINIVIVAIEVLVWPAGLPWGLVFLNIGIMVVLLTLWAGMFKLRGGPQIES
ncbi:MAG: NADH-quinone oxidoreductase subunit H, partial [Chloroflexi bacterium CG07_land_8_20_14_0_80_51_10]